MSHVDVIVVGSGIAGLTSAAYLCKERLNVLLLEKEAEVGGLLGSFTVDGHVLDKGARSIIDSGIVTPMLKQLGLHIDFIENPIRITIGKETLVLNDKSDIARYGDMLKRLYPQNKAEIDAIIADIYYVMKAMDVLYGIENPMFLPKPYNLKYIIQTLLPWFFRFSLNMGKAMKLSDPINNFLRTKTRNESLIQIITQHFFSMTPTFFALSYFTLYLQYHYPKGSTQTLVDALEKLITSTGGEIKTSSEVTDIDIEKKMLITKAGDVYTYDQMIWAADTNGLYRRIDIDKISSMALRSKVKQAKMKIEGKKGADSVLTLYILTDLPPIRFQEITGPHCFYTPDKEGLASISLDDIRMSDVFTHDPNELFAWITRFVRFNTLEISIPTLRDPSLSPAGQTGLIVSLLFDYGLIKHIEQIGLYEDFKKIMTDLLINELTFDYIEALDKHVLKTIISTPLSIERRTFNTEGSLTGWSFGNQPFPAEYRMINVKKAVLTVIDSIKQAGQWTFNPAGVPVSILTGKLAADAVIKDLKKRNGNKKGGTAFGSN